MLPKIIGSKLDDTQCGFRRGRRTTEQISTLQQIFKKSLEHAKHVDTCFVDLGMCTTGFLVKSFGGCHGSTVLTGVSCWLSSNCILAQKFASTELNHNRALLVLDSDKDGVYCHYYS